MTEQERLDILTRDFKKLDENWKDYIWGLTQKLADITCEGFSGEYDGSDIAHSKISGIIRLEPVLGRMPCK